MQKVGFFFREIGAKQLMKKVQMSKRQNRIKDASEELINRTRVNDRKQKKRGREREFSIPDISCDYLFIDF